MLNILPELLEKSKQSKWSWHEKEKGVGVEVDLRQGFFGKGEEWPWECEPGYVEKSWRVNLTGSGMGLKPNGTKSPKNDAFTDAHGY